MALGGFTPGQGTDFTYGDEPEIAKRLQTLGERLHITIYGISGHRTPQHSVDVGGFANDPHTRGQAADIGVNAPTRASAASLTDAQLASVGLYRPYSGAAEINHVELKPGTPGTASRIASGALDAAKLATNVPGTIVGAVAGSGNVVTDAAGGLAKDAVGAIWGAVKDDGVRALMYVLLVAAGMTLAVAGVARATGVGQKLRQVAGVAAAAETGGVL